MPRTLYSDWWAHIYREQNYLADSLANRAMDHGGFAFLDRTLLPLCDGVALRGFFDGGHRSDAGDKPVCTGSGWLVRMTMSANCDTSWKILVEAGVRHDNASSAAYAEWFACFQVTQACIQLPAHSNVHLSSDVHVLA